MQEGWEERMSKSRGKPYFLNKLTKESVSSDPALTSFPCFDCD